MSSARDALLAYGSDGLAYLAARGDTPEEVLGWLRGLLWSGDPELEALAARALLAPHDPAEAVLGWGRLTPSERAILGELRDRWGGILARRAAQWRADNPEAAARLDRRCAEGAARVWDGAAGEWACAWGANGFPREDLLDLPDLPAAADNLGDLIKTALIIYAVGTAARTILGR